MSQLATLGYQIGKHNNNTPGYVATNIDIENLSCVKRFNEGNRWISVASCMFTWG